MAKNEQPKPKSILEALGPRAEEMEPEPTTEEHVTNALGSAGLIDRLESEQYPEMPPQKIFMGEKPWPGLRSPPKMGQQMIPASNIVPPPAAETSIPELRGQPPQKINHDEFAGRDDPNLRRIKDFVHGELYSVNWVRLHLLHVSRIQQALPSPTLWAIPGNLDVAKLVYDVALSPGYVEVQWPVLQTLMGPSIDNIEWCVGVLTTLALFDAIHLLPYAGMQAK